AETAVAEERDAKQRSQEHARVSEVKDGPRHGLERGLTDEVEGYDIDGTVDHESKDEQADRAAIIGQSFRGDSEEIVDCVAAIRGAGLSSCSAHMMSGLMTQMRHLRLSLYLCITLHCGFCS